MSKDIIEEIRETLPTYDEERALKLTRDALAPVLFAAGLLS